MQILGPVRQEKVIELLEKGSLREEDEVSAANGFWFCLHEKELVERYLYNSEKQPFNPISEAKSVLTIEEQRPISVDKAERREERVSPSQDDLEYPTIEIAPVAPEILDEDEDEDERDDVTMMINEEAIAQIEPLVEKTETNVEVEFEPIEIPAPVEELIQRHRPSEELDEAASTIKIHKPKGKKHRPTPTIKKNDRYLFVLLILVGLLIAGIVYYYRTVLNKPLPGFEISLLIPSAQAQSILSSGTSKKKILKATFL